MAQDKTNYILPLIAIVAIVAIVGMVVLFMNMKAQTAYASSYTSDENLQGFAAGVGCRDEADYNHCVACCRIYGPGNTVCLDQCYNLWHPEG